MTAIVVGGIDHVAAAMPVMQAAFDPAYGEAWSAAQCAGVLALPGAVLLLAGDAHAPLGFALHRIVADEGELMLLAVHPTHHRKHIGWQLLHHSMSRATSAGAVRYFLEVRHDNPATDLYRRAGFELVGRRRDYYLGADGTRRDALTFSRGLP